MIVGIGTDIIEISRIEKVLNSTPRFLAKNFTAKENDYFATRKFSPNTIAGNFAAKEAISKALGTGFSKFELINIEILRNEEGAPIAFLHAHAMEIAKQKNIENIWITISHCKDYAVAHAIAES